MMNEEGDLIVKKDTDYDVFSRLLTGYLNKEFLSKLLSMSLYQSDFNSNEGNDHELIKYFKDFLISLRKDIKEAQNLNINHRVIYSLIDINVALLDLRKNITVRLAGYDTVFNHFTKLDTTARVTIQGVIDNDRIRDTVKFRERLDEIIKLIDVYYKFKKLAMPALRELGALWVESEQSAINPITYVSAVAGMFVNGYSNMSKLSDISDNDKFKNYMIFDNKSSVGPVSKELVKFLSTSFNRYRTGYPVIDKACGGGIESGSVSIISGPSNHAKSIFMINIIRNVLELNDLKENEALLMVTLEDDKFKLLSRILSIFGNFSAIDIKEGYKYTNNIINKNPDLISVTEDFWNNQINESIISITNNNGKTCKLIIMHGDENEFSMTNINKFIDQRKMEGTIIKFVAIDYIDVMCAAHSNYSSTHDDYNLHGDIVHDMKQCAKSRGIPILTISQNNRGSEDIQIEQTNSNMGGSIKKIRYADLIIMIRQDNKNDIKNNSTIGKHTNIGGLTNVTVPIRLIEDSIPFEVSITKNKSGDLAPVRYHIFSKQNLKIHSDAVTYFKEMQECDKKSSSMRTKLGAIEDSTLTIDTIAMEALDLV
ncbi:MAG: hypothetical protein H8D97_01820 [Proteobacteria bacterium]|nr:hypothetical protein [Pseudomonadota bacterium]